MKVILIDKYTGSKKEFTNCVKVYSVCNDYGFDKAIEIVSFGRSKVFNL